MENKASAYNSRVKYGHMKKRDIKERIYRLLVFVALIGLWQYLATKIGVPLLLPSPKATGLALIKSATDMTVLVNLSITMHRVMKGFLVALLVGVPLGYIMGLSQTAEKMLSGIIDSVRQVPIMALVPLLLLFGLALRWPTIFMIALSGIFQ